MSKEWATVPLGNAARPVQRAEAPVAGKPYRQIGVRLWGQGAYERETIDGSGTKYQTLSRVEADDIIVNKIWARNGSVAVVDETIAGCYGSSEFPTFAIDHNAMNPRWFHWLTKTKGFWRQCDAKSKGTSGQNRIRPEKFLEITIPLPSLPEQQRIVARIEELAAKIAEAQILRQSSINRVEELPFVAYKQVQVAAQVNGNTVPLRQIISKHDSGWSPQCSNDPARLDEWGVLKTTCVQWSGYEAKQNKALLPGAQPKSAMEVCVGDVLITRAGPVNRVGIACAVTSTPPKLMLSDKIVRVTPNESVISEYLAIILATPKSQEYLRLKKTGMAASQVNISRDKILNLQVPVPPIPVQLRLVNYVNNVRSKVSLLKQLQAQTAAELDAMLPAVLDKAFKGEL